MNLQDKFNEHELNELLNENTEVENIVDVEEKGEDADVHN